MSDTLLCTIAETAALLHVSVDTVRRQITAGIIPVKRLRSTIRVSRAWVESYAAESAPVLLTRRQVSQKLNVSVDSVRTLQVKGMLPTVIIAGQRIPAAAVAEYVKRNSFAFLRSGICGTGKVRASHPTGRSIAAGSAPTTLPAPPLYPVPRSRWSQVRGA